MRFDLQLHGVEKLLVNEWRQQNIVEGMVHWTGGEASTALGEASFFLMTGTAEDKCVPQLAQVASSVLARVVRGELELLEITAIFGAQVIASFASMTIQLVPSVGDTAD